MNKNKIFTISLAATLATLSIPFAINAAIHGIICTSVISDTVTGGCVGALKLISVAGLGFTGTATVLRIGLSDGKIVGKTRKGSNLLDITKETNNNSLDSTTIFNRP